MVSAEGELIIGEFLIKYGMAQWVEPGFPCMIVYLTFCVDLSPDLVWLYLCVAFC